jgi:hypothetical protein
MEMWTSEVQIDAFAEKTFLANPSSDHFNRESIWSRSELSLHKNKSLLAADWIISGSARRRSEFCV